MKGDKGRQMNLCAQRAVPDSKAGRHVRDRETRDTARQMNSVELKDNSCTQKGDKGRGGSNKGRQMHPQTVGDK